MSDILFKQMRMVDGRKVDILSRGGIIANIDPAGMTSPGPGTESVDGAGRLVLPSLVESHVHLDKTLWGGAWRPGSGGPTIREYIDNERRILREITTPIAERSGPLLEHIIANGSLHVRSHIDVDPEIGLRHVEAMLALRERYRDIVSMQFVAFPQTGMLVRPGTSDLMREALRLGVESVGGLDPAGIDLDPVGHLRTIFDMAEAEGCGVDIHLHDPGELGIWQIERIADFTQSSGLAGKVMISHAYCLGMVPEARLEGLGRRLADLRISLMTTAPADIAVPPVAFLKSLGVNICCGSDGIRDAWSPLGNGDMLERAFLMAFRFDWSRDEQFSSAFSSATEAGARALGLKDYGLAVGRPANFVAIDAMNLGDALARRPKDRLIVSHGRVVARDGVMIQSRV